MNKIYFSRLNKPEELPTYTYMSEVMNKEGFYLFRLWKNRILLRKIKGPLSKNTRWFNTFPGKDWGDNSFLFYCTANSVDDFTIHPMSEPGSECI